MTSLHKNQKSISDFIVLCFIISLLAIDFFPYFKSIEIINPQFLYLSFINLLMGIYFYFNNNIIDLKSISILKKSYTFRLYFVFLLSCGLSFFAAKNTSLVITRLTQLLIIFCLFINLSILLKNKLNLFYNIVFIVAVSAFFQSWQQLYIFLHVPRGISVLELLNNLKGNTGNINILAASLTIKIPFLLLGITYYNDYKKYFLVLTLFSVVTVIFLTGARTALINLFLVFLIYIVYLLKENSFNKSSVFKSLLLIATVLISTFFSNRIFEKSKDNSRYVSLENRIQQINTEDESANTRLRLWENAIKITNMSPIFGIGLGNYKIESIPYERTFAIESIASLNTHNDFLEICAETGIVNSLIYFSLFVFIFIRNIKKIFKSHNTETKTISILILLLVIIYGIDSTFNFPLYRPTMQIFLALLFALTVINNSKSNHQELSSTVSKNKTIYLIIIIVASITSYSAFVIYKASNLEYLIILDDINSNENGVLTGDEVVNRMPRFPNIMHTSESFYEYAGIYYIREKNYEKAFKCFSKASKISPYMGRINFYKYVISNKKGNIDSAYIYVKQAFYLRPLNFTYYKNSINLAAGKQDTIEILREHKLLSKYRKTPEVWTIAISNLQRANFDQKNLIAFIDQGLRVFPKDSTLLKQKNDFLITNLIIKGQDFISKSKFDKALESYQKALKIDSTNIYVLQNLGFFYFNFGQNKQAIYYFTNALKHPGLEDGKTEFYLGISYLKNNDKENACKCFNISKSKNFGDAAQSIIQNCK